MSSPRSTPCPATTIRRSRRAGPAGCDGSCARGEFVSAAACGEPDTGCVSIAALAAQVDQVLRRGYALFGDLVLERESAFDADSGLAAARDLVYTGQLGIAGLSGDLATTYRGLIAGAGTALGDA